MAGGDWQRITELAREASLLGSTSRRPLPVTL
jgi:hypothetical protein